MQSMYESGNRLLSRISVAARAILSTPTHSGLFNLFNSGPTIRSRSRLALAAVFFVATPIVLIGVLRMEKVAKHASLLHEYDDYRRHILETKIAIKDLDLALWEYVVERQLENGQAAIDAAAELKRAIATMVIQRPDAVDIGPKDFLTGATNRLDTSIKRSVTNYSAMASVRLSLLALLRDIHSIERHVIALADNERQYAIGALSKVGRDLLVLFLLLLCACPIFVFFVPAWLMRPLTRLRQMATKIESGHAKDIVVLGSDEIAVIAKSIRSLFLKKEEIDNKKSAKIFELRNVLRSVLKRVEEPIFIVDGNLKINFTNEAASQLVGIAPHQMEGTFISDCVYSPPLKKALEKGFMGDVSESSLPLSLEFSDGREVAMQGSFGVIRNRDGDISRAVIVLNPQPASLAVEASE